MFEQHTKAKKGMSKGRKSKKGEKKKLLFSFVHIALLARCT